MRWKVLRKPWHQPRGSKKDEREDEAFHIIAKQGNEVVGVGRVHFNSPEEAQIRYMAVEEEMRSKGIGTKIL